ncbi:SGNH/GDSL hydrolase family protein [Ravibacter arvi]|uniref:SGNH/GDSL hydrolase family protein n=1 Tax=Ravibacter arvi TaxID=2051041 RepID=A0ABP8LWR5_9BACT
MKLFFRIKLLVLVSGLFFAFSTAKPVRVVFFGDSITRAGVEETGYITQMARALKQKGLGEQYELIGAGIGGNKVYDLYLRLEDDVLSKKPDVVFVYVGINDVWHKSSHGTGTDPEKYVKFYQAIIKKLKAQGARIILCTPSVIGEKNDFSNQQDGDLNQYANLVRQLAETEKVELCDLRKVFVDYLKENNPENRDRNILTTDRVHLNEKGNGLVATTLMEALLKK